MHIFAHRETAGRSACPFRLCTSSPTGKRLARSARPFPLSFPLVVQILKVEMTRIEPATSWLQTRRSNQAQ